jgi:hypothetical protein
MLLMRRRGTSVPASATSAIPSPTSGPVLDGDAHFRVTAAHAQRWRWRLLTSEGLGRSGQTPGAIPGYGRLDGPGRPRTAVPSLHSRIPLVGNPTSSSQDRHERLVTDTELELDKQELHDRWLAWAMANLGSDEIRAAIAAGAAIDAIVRGDGFNTAAEAARSAWFEAVGVKPAGMVGSEFIMAVTKPNRPQVMVEIAAAAGLGLAVLIGFDITTNCWECGGWFGPVGALVGDVEVLLFLSTIIGLSLVVLSLVRQNWARRTSIFLFSAIAVFYLLVAFFISPATNDSAETSAALSLIGGSSLN